MMSSKLTIPSESRMKVYVYLTSGVPPPAVTTRGVPAGSTAGWEPGCNFLGFHLQMYVAPMGVCCCHFASVLLHFELQEFMQMLGQ